MSLTNILKNHEEKAKEKYIEKFATIKNTYAAKLATSIIGGKEFVGYYGMSSTNPEQNQVKNVESLNSVKDSLAGIVKKFGLHYGADIMSKESLMAGAVMLALGVGLNIAGLHDVSLNAYGVSGAMFLTSFGSHMVKKNVENNNIEEMGRVNERINKAHISARNEAVGEVVNNFDFESNPGDLFEKKDYQQNTLNLDLDALALADSNVTFSLSDLEKY